MYFDGATRTNEFGEAVSGVGIIFHNPDKVYIPHFLLLEPYSYNATKYTAPIMGLELVLESGITILGICHDSQLIIKEFRIRSEETKLAPLLQQSSTTQGSIHLD